MKLIFIIFLFPIQLFAQDISGVWTGYLYNDTTRQNLPYELAINQDGHRLSGYSHTIFIIDSVKNVGVKSVKIKSKDGYFFVEDDKLIFNNYPEPPAKGVRSFSRLSLSENDTSEILSGNWWTNSTKIYNSLTGTVFLQRKKAGQTANTLIVQKLVQMGLSDKLSFLGSIAANDLIAMNNPLVAKNEKISSEEKSNQPPKKIETESSVVKNEPPVSKEKTVESPAIETKKPVSVSQDQKEKPATVIQKEPVKKPLPQKEKRVAEPQKNKQPVTVVASKNEKSSLPKNDEKNIRKDAVAQKDTVVKKDVEVAIAPKKDVPVAVAEKKNIDKNPAPKIPSSQKNLPTILVDPETEVATAAAEISKRKIETIRTVDIVEDSLVFSLYDNGSVDGDTVTVVLNGQVIMPRVGLLGKAYNKTVYLTPEMGNTISVVMYAENLGSIPPNTGLLVIRERSRIFEIRFSGDLKKNSEIILKRVQKE